MKRDNSVRPIDILLVEDNPADADLARDALSESKLNNNLFIDRGHFHGVAKQLMTSTATPNWIK